MWVLCILIFVWCMCCMFGVCMMSLLSLMSLSHSLPCVHLRPLVHINHTPMLGVCMIVVCIWWVVSLWMWNVSLGWIYTSFLLSFCVFLVMFVVKRLARSKIRGCCRCIDVRYACAWPEVTMPYCLHVSYEVFFKLNDFKCFLKIVTVIYLHLKSNQLWIERTHMTIRMLSRLTLRKMRRMVESDTDGYGSTFVCMSFLILTLCVLCLLSAYYCRVCSGYVMMGNDGTRTLKLAHSWEAVRFVSWSFVCPWLSLLNVRIMKLSPPPLSWFNKIDSPLLSTCFFVEFLFVPC